MRYVCLLLGLSTLLSLASARPFSVAAYLPEWRYEGANWDTIFGTVTHLILFSIEVTPQGAPSALDRIPRPELLAEVRVLGLREGRSFIRFPLGRLELLARATTGMLLLPSRSSPALNTGKCCCVWEGMDAPQAIATLS